MRSSGLFEDTDVVLLYTSIGRGHPSYLDGICYSLEKNHTNNNFSKTSVFALSRGLSLSAWKLVRFLYRFGSRGGLITSLYTLLRKFLGDSGDKGMLLSLLGRDIRSAFLAYRGIIVVAHPLLAKMLSDQNRVVYQHGEFAVPPEALPSGCELVLVPDQDCVGPFISAGIENQTIAVAGQCIDSRIALNADRLFQDRLKRLEENNSLTVALFTSGARPKPHVQKILGICKSLSEGGHRAVIFTENSEKYKADIVRFLKGNNIDYDFYPDTAQAVTVVHSEDRQSEDDICEKLFTRFDVFAAPAHERVHWSLGLGLPQFVLCPHIGTFSPENARRVIREKVGQDVSTSQDAENFLQMLNELLQSGELGRMSQRGFKPERLNGFNNSTLRIARLINSSD